MGTLVVVRTLLLLVVLIFGLLVVLVSVVLGVNTEGSHPGSDHAASEELGFILIVDEFGVFGEIERDDNGALSNLLGVNDLGVAGSKGWVEAESSEVSERKFQGSGGAVDSNAGDGMLLHLVADMMPAKEESSDAGEEEESKDGTDGLPERAAFLGLTG